MPSEPAPAPIQDLAEARARARRAHDWPTADRLKAEIEATGWKVVDAGTMWSLERAAVPDVVQDGAIRYGSSASVPSRLVEPASGTATVVIVSDGDASAVARSLAAIAVGAPAGTQVVVVADGIGSADAVQPDTRAAAEAAGLEVEGVSTAVRLGLTAARNAGIRRAAAPVIVLVEPGVEAPGSLVGALVDALDAPGVAVAGPVGLVSPDLARWQEAVPGRLDVDAISGAAIAFRRADYTARGPLDEGFGDGPYLDVWWSLVLRDTADDDAEDALPRRAVVVGDLPPGRPASPAPAAAASDEARRERRARYRLLKRFATRTDLLGDAG